MDEVLHALAHSDDEERLINALDEASKLLARDAALRNQLEGDEQLWKLISHQWDLVSAGSEDEVNRSLALSLARFTRNAVAGVPTNQQRAYEFEERIRNVLYYQTSFVVLQEADALPLTRMLVQTLSNMITSNEALLTNFWTTHLELSEQRNILIRLLQAHDEATVMSTLVLVYNCLHDSPARCAQLSETAGGKRVLVLLLDRTQHLSEKQDDSPAFKIAYQLFEHLFDNGLAPSLWTALQPPPLSSAQ
ncbi:hypothetical protein EXIGLDRAFT_833616 [Exidia glandulosa HHB12029]|uniref:SPIN90/Ldb17 leucine-rich domain-containing protein n=1 Tax=Exidia glandulosa HHB12029 TaxID=1314781 RepID=A0A165KI63_EXIGL|nr:hypothetical protein EXIGLDRAFT_833616 [Exidia glandulosa HHB12029]